MQVVKDDYDMTDWLEENGFGDLSEVWLELLDREPEEQWLPLANAFFKDNEIPFVAVKVVTEEDEFIWTLEEK